MLNRTEAVVLKSMAYGEADLIVTYLSRDHGIMKAFAKSPRKTKSRFGSSLEPLTHARIGYFGKEDAGLPRLTQSDIITPFHALREDYSNFMRLCGIAELLMHFLPERDPNQQIFDLLIKLLSRIRPGEPNEIYYLYFRMRLLSVLGFLPRLESCGRCGTMLREGVDARFYVMHGAIICSACRPEGGSITLGMSALKFYPSFMKWSFENLDRVKAPEALLQELSALADAHIRHLLARPLKSAIFAEKSAAPAR